MQATAQQLAREGLPIEEFPQTPANLTAASENLRQLILDHNLILYPDAAMRLAASRAIAVETNRGWRIAKDKQSHKIDVVLALAMACHAAVNNQEPIGITALLADPEVAARSGLVTAHNPAGLTSPYNHSQMRNGVMGERMALQMGRSGGRGLAYGGPHLPYWPRGW
jgi:hypothetical protein